MSLSYKKLIIEDEILRRTIDTDLFIKIPENRLRNLAETEAMDVWKETGMLLIKNFLPNDVIDGLHEYAMTKIADGADPGDHFRTTAIKTGYEGRGWAQRAALRRKRPDLLGKFSNRL